MFKSAATNSLAVFDELEQLFLADIREGAVDEFMLARAKRQAEALMNADPAEGHIALSAIAALKWDVDGAEHHVDAALRRERSVGMLCNAITTFEFLNRSDLAWPHAMAAGQAAPHDEGVVQQAIASLLSGGYVNDAANLTRSFQEIEKDAFMTFNPVELLEALDEIGVDEEHVRRVLSVARNVLIEQKRRARELGIYTERDPDGGMVVAYELGFAGTLQDEFALEEKLSEGLGNLEGWNPSKLTVHFKYLLSEDVSTAS